MAYIRFKVCTVIMALALGITGIKAEGPTKDALQTEGVYKHLWETKSILAVEISPDNKHVFVAYSTPEMDSTTKDVTSHG